MSLTRSILNEFRPLFRLLDEPFMQPFAPRHLNPNQQHPVFGSFLRPAIDLTEEGNHFVVEAELPGVKKENIEVRVEDNGRSLTIEGKTFARAGSDAAQPTTEGSAEANSTENAVSRSSDSTALSTERSFVGSSSFTRTIWLPRPVDASKVSAKFVDGVLTLQVPKMEDKEAVKVNIE